MPDINRLNAQHAELLRQAESTISSTETHVQWLREERLQARLSLSTDTLPLPSASSCTRANRGSEDGEDDSPIRASSTEPAVRGGATRARRAAELLRGATEAVLSRLSSDVHNSVGRRHLQVFLPSSTWSTWSAQCAGCRGSLACERKKKRAVDGTPSPPPHRDLEGEE